MNKKTITFGLVFLILVSSVFATTKYWNAHNANLSIGNMFFDETNDRIGIGTESPSATLDIDGTLKLRDQFQIYPYGNNNFSRINIFGTPNSYDNLTNAFYMYHDPDGSLDFPYKETASIVSHFINGGGKLRLTTSKDGAIGNWNTGLVINKDGNVGIGTTNPSEKLGVYSNETTWAAQIVNQNKFSTSAHGLLVSVANLSSNTYAFSVYNGGLHKFVVKGNGNVGIGTNSPNDRLTLDYGQNISWEYSSGNSNAYHKIGHPDNGVGPLTFTVEHSSWPSSEQDFEFKGQGGHTIMMMLNNGKVGINDTTPDTTLDVGGSFSVASATIASDTDNYDVSDIGILLVDTSAATRTIGGLSGGVEGQVLHIIKKYTANDLVIENDEATGTQKFLNPDNADLTIPGVGSGGVTAVYVNNYWYIVEP